VEVVEVRRQSTADPAAPKSNRADWYWIYRNEPRDTSLRSNDDFDSLDAALTSASVAYPHLQPVVVDSSGPHEEHTRRKVSRRDELRRLVVLALGAAVAVGIARWRGRRAVHG
jgi:hypothetical protein